MRVFVTLCALFLIFVGIGVPSEYKYIPNVYNPSATPLPEEELECLIQNIYFEASTQNEYGKIGVAQVTLNRVDSPDFPNTICGVVHQGPRAGKNPVCVSFPGIATESQTEFVAAVCTRKVEELHYVLCSPVVRKIILKVQLITMQSMSNPGGLRDSQGPFS